METTLLFLYSQQYRKCLYSSVGNISGNHRSLLCSTTNDPKTLQFGWKTFVETTILVSVAQTTINLWLHNNNKCSNVCGVLLKTLAFLGAYNHNKVVLRQVHENEQQSNFTFGNGFAIWCKTNKFCFLLIFFFRPLPCKIRSALTGWSDDDETVNLLEWDMTVSRNESESM